MNEKQQHVAGIAEGVLTVTKRFGEYPAAHRQWCHDGHCADLHGHDWAFLVTFTARVLDSSGFIIDLGRLSAIKAILTHTFDHTILLDVADPLERKIQDFWWAVTGRNNVRLIPQGASCEGLAQHVCGLVSSHLLLSGDSPRVKVKRVVCCEGANNSATYENPS